MNSKEAYYILKGSLELDEDTQPAYDHAVAYPNEYMITIGQIFTETKSSIEIGQSLMTLGEIVKEIYNGTHRLINNKIIDMPGADFCIEIGRIASEALSAIQSINNITEEIAASTISCDSTVDVSYG